MSNLQSAPENISGSRRYDNVVTDDLIGSKLEYACPGLVEVFVFSSWYTCYNTTETSTTPINLTEQPVRFALTVKTK